MNKKYPKHFYEPIRVEIAVSQMQHDARKLFPSLGLDALSKIDADIAGWFEGERYELEPVHDFWNFFGGFARGLKLKSLLYWVTAENVKWKKEKVSLDDVIITWDFPGLEFIGKAPYLARSVRRRVHASKNNKELDRIRKDARFRSARYAPRDQFPIVVFHDQKGETISKHTGHYILEGNRRTVGAIIRNETEIGAYVGEFMNYDDIWPENYWLKTGILRDLIFMSFLYDREKDTVGFSAVRKFYQLLMRDFEIARIATFDKSFKNFESNDRLLREIFKQDLK